jgi:PAS domain S-box-containing protein
MNKILLVDKNTEFLFKVEKILNEYIPDIEVFSSQTCLNGINIATIENPDVIFLDSDLPDMDGNKTCRILKNPDKNDSTPIIIFSSEDTDNSNIEEYLECGADIFLHKPIENQELIAQIYAALKLKKNEDSLRNRNVSLTKDINKTRNLYEDLFNSINDSIIIHDIDGKILEINSQACLLLGYSREEFLTKKIGDLNADYEMKYTDLGSIVLKDYFNKNSILYETEYVNKTGKIIPVEINSKLFKFNNIPSVLNVIRDVSERKLTENEKESTIQLFKLINCKNELEELMRLIIVFIKSWSDCESVGIRLKDGDDYPYYITRGFDEEFIRYEKNLCARDFNGKMIRDETGNPVIECMCGNVICGRFDPKKPFFTEFGSFWSNCTTELLASTNESDRQGKTRNRCNGQGYESVALIPLKTNNVTYGLIQLNDRRKNRFTINLINMFERISNHIAIALSEKKLGGELKKSEELYRSLFENMLNGYSYCRIEFDDEKPVDWTYLTVNRAFENLTGLKNVSGKKASEVIPGITKTSPDLLEIYGKTALTGFPQKFETYVKELDDWFDVSVFSPEKGYFVAVFDVITDRKLAEDKLRESEERYRSVIEKAYDGIALTDEAGRVILWNKALEKQTGIRASDVIGKYIWDADLKISITGQHKTGTYEELRSSLIGFLKTGKSSWGDSLIEGSDIHPDGTAAFREWRTSSIMTDKGFILVNVSRDITERKKAEGDLIASEKKYRLLVNTLQEGIWVIDKNANTIFVNPKMAEMLGYGIGEMTGRPVFDFMDRQGIGNYKINIEPKRSDTSSQFDFEFVKKDGFRMTASIEASPIFDDLGNYAGTIAGIQDITQRKKAEEEKTNSLIEKEALLRELYHRTRNNMMVICSLLKLESFYVKNDKIREIFLEIENKIRSMAMVHQMLYRNKNLSLINLKKYVEELSDLLLKSYIGVNSDVSFILQLSDIEVLIDTAVPFGLVLNELITNSFKYAFPGNRKGTITITIRKEKDDMIELFYSDNGIGIPDGFNILDQPTLGLQSMISIIREQMQGEISFRSDNGLNYFIVFKDNIYKERV